MRAKNMAVGTSQRGVEAGKPINNIQARQASVRNRTLFALFPDGMCSTGNAASGRDGCGREPVLAGQKRERRGSPRRSKVERAKTGSLQKQKGCGNRDDGASLLLWQIG